MSDLASIRAAIVARMQSVPHVGLVHAYERYAATQPAFRALYTLPSGEIRGWCLQRLATRETSPAIARWDVIHRWRIKGWMSLRDEAASAIAFDALIEALRDAFRADDTLGAVVAGDSDGQIAGLQVEESGPVMFAGVLCHAAHLLLVTRTFY